MIRKTIDTGWSLRVIGDNVYHIPETPVEAKVPSSVYSTFLEHGLIPDPFYRDNELDATRLMDNDFVYETSVTLSQNELESDRVLLHFEGIDTLADIYVNDRHLGKAANMHRVYEYDVTDLDVNGELRIKVILHSPTKFIKEAYEADPIGGSSDAMPGFPHIRKAACMFGWDWGPRLPDAGLFRPVEIICANTARIESVYYAQEHHVTGKSVSGNEVDSVTIHAKARVEWMQNPSDQSLRVMFAVKSPDGSRTWSALSAPVDPSAEGHLEESLTGLGELRYATTGADIHITAPQLWWPNGYGDQPLYSVEAILAADEAFAEGDKAAASALDVAERKIGLRTMTVNTDPLPNETRDPHMKDQQPDLDDGRSMIITNGGNKVIITDKEAKPLEGENFAFEVNGLQIFAMGADYIPEDNLLSRHSRERTRMLMETCVESHFNCLRVWGGGYYLDDFFYDLCDEYGLLIWQDFMFACAAYELTDDFEANMRAEVRHQIRRLRHHPSLGVWSGNNENEGQFETYAWPETQKQFYDYIRMYEYIIPQILKEEDPMAFYWPSSPSSGGNFENTNAENRGDVHYWGVWHGNEPFTAYRKHHYRFLSEFGFQSFPAIQTINRFTKKEDQNVFSRVMEMHQRNKAANGKILSYLSATYLYPKNFDELIYCSQLLQADAIRYGVEHFRRFRGTCMGTVVWQLDDCWPVASWASVDYYGNWKALQYAEKRMFAPILLSCEEHGEIDQKPFPNSLPQPVDISADLHVANETGKVVRGKVNWSLRNPDSSVIREGSFDVEVPAFGGTWLPHLDFNGEDPLRVPLTYELVIEGQIISGGSALFCAPKHYHFVDPKLSVSVEGDVVTVTSESFAKSVSVETENGVLRLDDNFVDMEAGTRQFHILPGRDFTAANEIPEGPYRVRSIYESADH